MQGLTFVKPHGGVLPVARQGLFKTRAEKRIHDRVGFPCTVGIRHGFAARFHPGFVHCLGVICFGGVPGDGRAGHAVALSLKRKRRSVAVTAVIARTADNDDVSGFGDAAFNHAGNGVACAAHQFSSAQNAGITVFKGAQFVKVKDLLTHGFRDQISNVRKEKRQQTSLKVCCGGCGILDGWKHRQSPCAFMSSMSLRFRLSVTRQRLAASSQRGTAPSICRKAINASGICQDKFPAVCVFARHRAWR